VGVAAAEQTLALDPEDTTAINLRAFALRQMGRGEVSRAELHDALRVAPEDATTHANLGWNHLSAGNRDEAMRHFREALRLDPELDWARHGVVETLKAHNIFYRQMLRYFLWMQSLGRAGQWRVLLGAWIGYIIVGRIADAVPAAKPWLLPLIVGYLAFALSTILAVPLFNLALHLHPFGRLALSRFERLGSYWTGRFLAGLILAGVGYLLWPASSTLSLVAFFGLMMIPVGITSQVSRPQPRRWMLLYTVAVGIAGLFGLAFYLLPESGGPEHVAEALARIGTALCLLAFPLAALVSIWVGNILNTMQWRR
jgi:tetratricopeptide (TPR) repeat protein